MKRLDLSPLVFTTVGVNCRSEVGHIHGREGHILDRTDISCVGRESTGPTPTTDLNHSKPFVIGSLPVVVSYTCMTHNDMESEVFLVENFKYFYCK